MDFAGNDGEFHRNLGDKVTIKGEGTKAASEYSGENIKTFADANGNLTVKMDKNLKTETIVATGKTAKTENRHQRKRRRNNKHLRYP